MILYDLMYEDVYSATADIRAKLIIVVVVAVAVTIIIMHITSY